MSKSQRFAASLLALALGQAGCSPAQPELAPQAPHGGSLYKLPGGQGNAEVVSRPVEGSPGRARLLVYYLDLDLKPLASAPTAATLKPKERTAAAVELKPGGEAEAEAGGLASPPFPFSGDIVGELTATIDGKPAAVVISIHP